MSLLLFYGEIMSVNGGRVMIEGSYRDRVQTRLQWGPFSDPVGARAVTGTGISKRWGRGWGWGKVKNRGTGNNFKILLQKNAWNHTKVQLFAKIDLFMC